MLDDYTHPCANGDICPYHNSVPVPGEFCVDCQIAGSNLLGDGTPEAEAKLWDDVEQMYDILTELAKTEIVELETSLLSDTLKGVDREVAEELLAMKRQWLRVLAASIRQNDERRRAGL